MNPPDRQTPRDPDDWFDEPEPMPPRRPSRASEQVDPDAQTREQAATPVDDWLAPEPLTRKRRPSRAGPIANRRILLALGIAVALLLVGLALGGVFSGGGNKNVRTPLTRQTAGTTTQSSTPTLVLPTTTVKLGDHGNAVKELQRALRSLGFTVATIDGVFGASTERELIAFQTAHHLSPDGVLGPATRAALLRALRRG
jgi:peptidoglycan hydrolase-like protein with peptidoglycan-binding domain